MRTKTKLMQGLALRGLALAMLAATLPAWAQQILLDKPVKAGELTLFPDLNDDKVYYYVSDKPRLATDANGRPQFSFLRYVDNVRSGADQPEAREGEGGGIVHAVVALAVSPEQLGDARRELQRVRPGARIEGPVVFKSGKFGLVSSFKDPQGGFTTQVVGLGNAPILDGEKAAVSMQLTKQGAKVLWESFNTPTPDISFSFEMDMTGFRSPHRAVIEADFDQIYEHQAFGAGLASSYLSAEIKTAFDDLTRKGAIKLTQVGADEKLDALITTAYNKIADMMFAPMGGTGTPDLTSLAGAAGGQGSLLDRASTQLQRARQEADQENARIRAENRAADERAAATRTTPPPATATATATQPTPPAATAQPGGRSDSRDISAAQQVPAEQAGPAVPAQARQTVQPPQETSQAPVSRAVGDPDPDRRAPRKEEVAKPAFAIVAAYEMKKVRQRGIFRIDLNKYNSDTLTLRFDENIGDLRSLKGDAAHFREVNLDDPLFRQREIVAFVDGLNAQDFGQYVNFVNVRLRKTHQGGQITDDEVRIDRNNFNKEGNNFKLLYGWKGDNDRRRWMDYEYKTAWSFFGGNAIEGDWQRASSGAINLAPPYQRRTVELQADPALIGQAGVRAITVKLYYSLGGVEQSRTVSLNPAKGQLSERVEFMLPANQYDYGYEISWRLPGNKTVSSGRKTTSDAILFVDELP